MNTKIRSVISAVLVAMFFIAVHFLGVLYSPVTGALGAQQLDDTSTSYVMAKVVRDGNIQVTGVFLLLFALLIVWWKPLGRLIHARSYDWPLDKTVPLVILAAFLLPSCAPVKVPDVVEIKSNETAWAIPMDGNSKDGQVKFNSVGFLNEHKVAAKRVWIDKVPRKTGRFWFDLTWIPSIQVITVDRSLVTGQWTDGSSTNPADNFGIGVVTRDSVKLRVGLTATASIDEDDASTYLYYHGARPLATVLTQNVYSFAVAELTREYSKLSLTEAQQKGESIYKNLFDDARKAFRPFGVNIQYMGNAEGLTYADPAVQDAINSRYRAEMSAQTAQQEQNAQKIRNETLVLNAQAEADSAQKLLAAKEASLFKNDLNIRMMTAQAALRWNGALPYNIMPANSPLMPMLNLGTVSK